MTSIRWLALGLCAIVLSFVPVSDGLSTARSTFHGERTTSDSLQSIASWLEKSGVEGAMGAEVADVLDIPRLASEDTVGARQMAFQSGETLYLAQVSADKRREFLLFMVRKPDRVYFYLSTVAEGFKKAFVSVPAEHFVAPLDAAEAEKGFREVVSYWMDIITIN